MEYGLGSGDPGTNYDVKVLEPANQAIALDPNNIRAYYTKSEYLTLLPSTERRLRSLAMPGLAVIPNDAILLLARAIAENSLGRYSQAKDDIERAMRLSPRDPILGYFHVTAGTAETGLGHFDGAIDEFHKALDMGWQQFYVHTNLAAAFALLGRMHESKAALAEALRLEPRLTVKWITGHVPSGPAVLDGLRKAGLPEE